MSVHVILLVILSAMIPIGLTHSEPVNSGPADQNEPPACEDPTNTSKVRTIGIVLFDHFELLDVFGPAEVFGNVGKSRLRLVMVAEKPGPIVSAQGPKVLADHGFEDCPPLDLVLVPGGIGTRKEMMNPRLLEWLQTQAESAELVLSVCTGSLILAKAGLLDGKRATTNKRGYRFLVPLARQVEWVERARWVESGKFVTSSGVSAGIDMSLRIVEKLWGKESAERIAAGMEHEWNRDPDHDPFAPAVQS